MTVLAVAVSGRGLVDPAEPVLRADDEGFARGLAAFSTLRVYGGRPFRLAEHVARLASSAERLGLPAPDRAELGRLVDEVLAAAGVPDCALRLTWTPGPPGGPPLALAVVSDVPAWIEPARARGQRLVSLLVPRRSEPWLLEGTKSTSYAVNMAAEAEAKRRGGDDAVFVDQQGVVLEGPVTNIWWREGSLLVTPSLELGILAGETRATLLELAESAGYGVEEGTYPLERLLQADEAFTSSSVREVMPVVRVDDVELPRGPAADAMQAALRHAAGGTASG
ncbi:MAG: aminotransferase class IV [Thermoleophilia bacterium]|nr:aminotransferase class IV [Thermoleophilia bacterium]